ncbi:MAG: universal stress protein [Bacteroidales bacterium]|nr:universal stress protein [Bacteroidales bacterium]
MEDKLVTLAIHSYEKAIILKSMLESEGITTYIQNVNVLIPQSSEGVRVRIKESDLPNALKVIEASSFKTDIEGDSENEDGKEDKKHKRTILIPVDFSDYSLKACKLGFSAAKSLNAKIIIAHVYYVPFIPMALTINDLAPVAAQEGLDIDLKEALQRADKGMKKLLAEIKSLQESGVLPEIHHSTIIREGIPEEVIVELGEELKPLMIVMGTRGASKRELEVLGSVTAEVIEQSKQKVLAVPENAPSDAFTKIRHIAFATNFDERAIQAFDHLMELLEGRSINYTIVHFKEKRHDGEAEEHLENMSTFLKKKYPNVSIQYKLIETKDMFANLNDFLNENSVDLLAITTHKRNPFSKLLYASFASKMLFYSKVPILVLRA